MYILRNSEETRQVYEMVFSHGVDEEERRLYLNDTEVTRKHFISQMHEFISKEYSSLKEFHSDIEIGTILHEIYQQTLHYIEIMNDDFVYKGEAHICPYIFFRIEEKIMTFDQ